jgi:D-beta-D-heptose 7-phosphate kinase/D-beta-D-heptose 1-phosphate adenosyltransferase
MTDTQLADLLQEVDRQKVLVVGDLMIDEYVHGTVNRISPEAPVPVVDVRQEEETLGGAGNVVKNLRTLGADAAVLSVIGEGKHGAQIQDQLQEYEVSLDNIIEEPDRVSSKKSRILADSYNQQIIRVDRETREDLQSTTYDRLMERYEVLLPSLDAIVLSDYGKGLLTPKFSRNILKKADREDVPTVVDPKGNEYGKYSGASIITPNTDETEEVTGITIEDDSSLQKAGSKILKQHSAAAILITRGSEGMALFETPGLSFERFEAWAREVYDVTGAGDTVVSMVALGLAISDDYPTAARLANVAAGIVVGKVGTATVSVDEIRDQLLD